MYVLKWRRTILMVLGAIALGCGWGLLVDNLIAFSWQSLTIEAIGAAIIGASCSYPTRSWWLKNEV